MGVQLKKKSSRQASNKQGRGASAVLCAVCWGETQRAPLHDQYIKFALSIKSLPTICLPEAIWMYIA
jgi:uncharacterized membrane protein